MSLTTEEMDKIRSLFKEELDNYWKTRTRSIREYYQKEKPGMSHPDIQAAPFAKTYVLADANGKWFFTNDYCWDNQIETALHFSSLKEARIAMGENRSRLGKMYHDFDMKILEITFYAKEVEKATGDDLKDWQPEPV